MRMWIVFRKNPIQTIKTYVEGLAASLAAPTRVVGEGIRVGITKAELDISVEKATAYVIMERVADVSVLLISAAALLPRNVFLLAIGAIIVGLIALESEHVEKLLQKIAPKWAHNTYLEARAIGKSRKKFVAILAVTLTLWLVDYGRLYIILKAMGVETPYNVVAGAVALSYILSAVSTIPGGLGVYEGGVAAILKVAGVPLSKGIAAVMYERLFSYWLIIGIGIISGARRSR